MALGGRILLVTLGKLTSKNFFIYEIDYHENKKRICSVLICGPLGTQKPAWGGRWGGGPSVFVFVNLCSKCPSEISALLAGVFARAANNNGSNTKLPSHSSGGVSGSAAS